MTSMDSTRAGITPQEASSSSPPGPSVSVPAPACQLLRSVLAPELLDQVRLRVDESYRAFESSHRAGDFESVQRQLPPGERFASTASSVTVGVALDHAVLSRVLAGCGAGATGELLRADLGSEIVCNLDQAWVRRQYAPANYPRWHAPHSWHQDGALGFDFLAHPDGNFPAAGILNMVTCWIALGTCGLDAPGLELVARRLTGLLAPGDLTDARVRARFAAEDFWRPELAAGDALLFRGDVLHRTHVTAAMARDRTSVELRFFAAGRIPLRLAADRFVPLSVVSST